MASCQRPATLISDEWCGARERIAGLHRLIKCGEAGTLRIRTRNELETCGRWEVYRVSQEECARLREGVTYVKVYRYNPKHLCPKLNGYVDNGQRKVWSSGGSTHCTCQLTSLVDVCPWVWCPMTECHLTLAYSRLIPECAVSHVTSVLAIHVSCIVLGTLRTTMTSVRVFL